MTLLEGISFSLYYCNNGFLLLFCKMLFFKQLTMSLLEK